MAQKELLSFGASDEQQNFVVDEIACISFSAYRGWVKAITLTISALIALAAFATKPIAGGIAIAVLFPLVKAVFSQSGYIATTGGVSRYSAKWSAFEALSKVFLAKSKSDNVHVSDETFTKKYLHVINPERVSGFKHGSTNRHYIFFAWAIILGCSLFWFSKYSQLIVPAIAVLVVIGFLVWQKGIQAEMVGGHKSFFEMSKRHADEVIRDIHRAVAGSATSASTNQSAEYLSLTDSLGVCSLVLIQESNVKSGTEEAEHELGTVFLLLKTASGGDEDSAMNSLKNAQQYIKASSDSLDEDFRNCADRFIEVFKKKPEYAELGNSLLEAMQSITEVGGRATDKQKELLKYISSRMPA